MGLGLKHDPERGAGRRPPFSSPWVRRSLIPTILHSSRGAGCSPVLHPEAEWLPALIELWSRLPRYRWLAKLTSVPGLNRVSVGIYDHVIAPGLATWARVRLARQQRAALSPR